MEFLTGLLPFFLALGKFWLERSGASIETKKRFFDFVEGLGNDNLISVSLTLAYEKHRAKMLDPNYKPEEPKP